MYAQVIYPLYVLLFNSNLQISMKTVKLSRLLLFSPLFFSSLVQAQLHISEVEMKDSTFLKEIFDFMNYEVRDSSVSAKGYIFLDIDVCSHSSVLFKCYINRNYASFDEIEQDVRFPDYYTFIKDDIILLYFRDKDKLVQRRFKEDSKQSFQRIIEPYLSHRKHVRFENDGHEYFFRPDETHMMGGGRTFVIYK